MAEGNKYGFGGIGAGGGIANLVAAPKVNPIRSGQFAPTPQRRLTAEKKPKKQILGALAGAASPFLAEAGLAGLSKIPGLEGLLFQPEAETKEDFGIAEPTTGTDETSTDPYLLEQKKLRQRVEAALPSTKLPRQKTILGKGLNELLTYAPALALSDEDDGSIASYIAAASSGKKLEGALDQSRLEAYLKREQKRGELLSDVGDFTDAIGNGTVLRDGNNKVDTVQRQFKISPDKLTKYILSQGDKDVDFVIGPDGIKHTVPKGQYYVREDFLLNPEKLPDPKPIKLLVDNISEQVSTGAEVSRLGPNGQVITEIKVVDVRDGGKLKTVSEMYELYGEIWHSPQPGFGYKDREFGSRQLAPAIDWMKTRNEKQTALQGTLRPLKTLAQLGLEAIGWDEKTGKVDPKKANTDLFTFTGGAKGLLVDLRAEVDSTLNTINEIYQGQGTSLRSILKQSQKAASQDNKYGTNVNYFTNLFDAQLNYDEAIQNKDVALINSRRKEYRQALRNYRDNVETQGGNITNLLDLDLDSDASWSETSVKRAAIISSQLKLAYASAAQDGSTGVALSDRDVNNYLEQVGFGYRNPKIVIDKIQNTFNKVVGDFDDTGITRQLDIASGLETPEAIDTVDVVLRTFGVSQAQLDELRDLNKPLDERTKLARDVMTTINKRTGGLGSTHFAYDRPTGRIKFKGVENILENQYGRSLEYFQNNLLKYNKTSVREIMESADNRFGAQSPQERNENITNSIYGENTRSIDY